MTDEAVAVLEPDASVTVDEDEFLDLAVQDSQAAFTEHKGWFPEEYVVGITGHRGSGKSLLLARYLLTALRAGFKVFTSLILYPEKFGITNKPLPIDLELLVSFSQELQDAVVGIEELDTWVEKKRTMSTSSILVEKWLRQMRKRGLKVIFTNQSPYLPWGIMEQLDMLIRSHDFYYSPWGIENNIVKGTSFYYVT